MPAKGWLSVRDLPTTKEKTIKEVMKDFQDNYMLCDCCDGKGYIVENYDEYFNGVSTVKVQGADLAYLDEEKRLTSETIKKIVETVVHGRKQCDNCNGFGFVKKSGKKINGKER